MVGGGGGLVCVWRVRYKYIYMGGDLAEVEEQVHDRAEKREVPLTQPADHNAVS